MFRPVSKGRDLTKHSDASIIGSSVPVFMIGKILTSNWFAALVLVVASASLVLLYHSGKTTEAVLGAALLLLALVLILMGSKRSDRDR